MGKRRYFDEDVNEVFDTFGVEVAIYFEVLRYRQQLNKGFFPLARTKIKERADLTFAQQRRARVLLETVGWIETKRHNQATMFRITELAKECTKHTIRRHNVRNLHAQRAYA